MFYTCKVAHQKDTVQGDCCCKIDGTGFHSAVANRAQICSVDCHKENNFTTNCHTKIIVPRIVPVKSQNLKADCQGLFLLWQTAVLERGLPQKNEILYTYSPLVRSAVSF
jgi:iron only hydrogenase large subunit-like protein